MGQGTEAACRSCQAKRTGSRRSGFQCCPCDLSRSSQNRLLSGGTFQPGEGIEEVTQAVARHTCGPGQVLIGDGVRAYGNDNHANAVVLPELAGIGPFGVHQVGSHRSLCNYPDRYAPSDVAAITYVACTKIREQAVAEGGTPSISGSENADHL